MKWSWILPLLLWVTSGCTPYWVGAQMQQDIAALEAEQKTLVESTAAREAEMTEMVASARADVSEIRRVLKEATELLQRNNADFGVEMEEVRQELQRIAGRMEEVEFKMTRIEQDQRLFKEDVDLRFSDGGGAQMPEEPDGLFKFASEKFAAGDYRVARKGFEAFLRKYSSDKRASEAVFFMGETFFKEKQWVSAVFEYQKILKQYSKSSRAADATFRIGESFLELKKCPEAKIFFDTVVNDFSKSKWAEPARRKLQSLKGDKC